MHVFVYVSTQILDAKLLAMVPLYSLIILILITFCAAFDPYKILDRMSPLQHFGLVLNTP